MWCSAESDTDFPVKSSSGKTLFYFEKKSRGRITYDQQCLIIVLRFGGLLLLLLFIYLLLIPGTEKNIKGSYFSFGVVAGDPAAHLSFPFLLNLRQFELFDPTIYGSNLVQRSLGDFLINSLFFCWIVLFTWYKVQNIKNLIQRLPRWIKWLAGILSLCLLIYSTFILSSVIRSIVADSKISFDVTNFESLDRYTVVGFLVLACLSFLIIILHSYCSVSYCRFSAIISGRYILLSAFRDWLILR